MGVDYVEEAFITRIARGAGHPNSPDRAAERLICSLTFRTTLRSCKALNATADDYLESETTDCYHEFSHQTWYQQL